MTHSFPARFSFVRPSSAAARGARGRSWRSWRPSRRSCRPLVVLVWCDHLPNGWCLLWFMMFTMYMVLMMCMMSHKGSVEICVFSLWKISGNCVGFWFWWSFESFVHPWIHHWAAEVLLHQGVVAGVLFPGQKTRGQWDKWISWDNGSWWMMVPVYRMLQYASEL